MKPIQHPFRRALLSFGLFCSVALSPWSFTIVQGQVEPCEGSEAVASVYLGQKTQGCVADRSACSSGGTCTCTYLDLQSAYTACTDGCAYTSSEYTVERAVTGVYRYTVFYDFNNFPIVIQPIFVEVSHAFTAGAEGSFVYNFEASSADSEVGPAEGGICTFEFNGEACSCDQYFCDDEETTYANRINCTGVEGGAVIDFCTGVSSSDSYSLLEILFAVPDAVCRGVSLDGTDLTDSTVPNNSTAAPSAVSSSTTPPGAIETIDPLSGSFSPAPSVLLANETPAPAAAADDTEEPSASTPASIGATLSPATATNDNDASTITPVPGQPSPSSETSTDAPRDASTGNGEESDTNGPAANVSVPPGPFPNGNNATDRATASSASASGLALFLVVLPFASWTHSL